MDSQKRYYRDSNDLEKLIDLLATTRPPAWRNDYPDASDLHEIMANTNTQQSTMLWLSAGNQLLGFAFVDPYGILRFELNPALYSTSIESEIFEFGNQQGIQNGHASIFTNCRLEDKQRIQALETHAFIMTENRTTTFVYDLTQNLSEPELPAGYHIQHSPGDREIEAIVALHQSAFGTTYMTTDERRNMMANPDYDSELDLVIIAPDG